MKKVGIYNKFRIIRRDEKGRKGGKHFDCKYFVLDLTHDVHAKAAVKTYAKSCKKDFPKLSRDLTTWLNTGRMKLTPA